MNSALLLSLLLLVVVVPLLLIIIMIILSIRGPPSASLVEVDEDEVKLVDELLLHDVQPRVVQAPATYC